KERPLLVRSPGRVNLIGEHTDYNDGFVLPGAINKALYFAVSPRPDDLCRVFAFDMNEGHEFRLSALAKSPRQWPNYLMGVVDQLIKAGHKVGGFNCVFGGNIPVGAGLSSSAALEAGLAVALNAVFELGVDDLGLARLAQKAENEFVGVQCGIMDQYVNVFGEQGKLLQIDCRSLEHKTYPFVYPVSTVLFDTRVSHSLATSEYNRRRAECAEGVAVIRKRDPSVTHLRDVAPGMLEESSGEMSATTYRRCKYVLEENERVKLACQALERKDLAGFGRLMYESHNGLSQEYEVSCPELDHLVESVGGQEGVYGARMMGGGFGGCTINLIEDNAVQEVTAVVEEDYNRLFGIRPRTYVTSVDAGTSIISVHDHARS
ncbi:MAG TPA: galactokinase, partial [Bacteroidota bacterium]